jgi:anti-sigma factor RsiW
MSPHLSDDQLLDRLYGLDHDEAHLATCTHCQQRAAHFEALQSALPSSVPTYAPLPIQAPSGDHRWLASAAAVACVALAGFAVLRSDASKPSVPEQAPTLEVGWYDETYSATREVEPRAASPIRALFADATAGEGVAE